jgi:hypothetical protein
MAVGPTTAKAVEPAIDESGPPGAPAASAAPSLRARCEQDQERHDGRPEQETLVAPGSPSPGGLDITDAASIPKRSGVGAAAHQRAQSPDREDRLNPFVTRFRSALVLVN